MERNETHFTTKSHEPIKAKRRERKKDNNNNNGTKWQTGDTCKL